MQFFEVQVAVINFPIPFSSSPYIVSLNKSEGAYPDLLEGARWRVWKQISLAATSWRKAVTDWEWMSVTSFISWIGRLWIPYIKETKNPEPSCLHSLFDSQMNDFLTCSLTMVDWYLFIARNYIPPSLLKITPRWHLLWFKLYGDHGIPANIGLGLSDAISYGGSQPNHLHVYSEESSISLTPR